MEVVNNRDLRIERVQLSRWEVNSYFIICPQTGQSALVDAPPGASTLIEDLKGTDLKYILLTHGHIDHIAGLTDVRSRTAAPLAAHPADQNSLPSSPDLLLNDGRIITLGHINIEVMHTPGHTPGSICFRLGEYLISGDTIFPGGPGRTGSPDDFQQVIKSITEKILVLPDEIQVLPGHGDPTTIKTAKEEYAIFASRQHVPGLCGDVNWLTS